MATSSSRASEDQRHQMLAPMLSCTVLAIFAVVARFVSRKLKKRPYAVHDYLIIAGMAGSLLQVAFVFQGKLRCSFRWLSSTMGADNQ